MINLVNQDKIRARLIVEAHKLATDLPQKAKDHRSVGHGGDDGVDHRLSFTTWLSAWFFIAKVDDKASSGFEYLSSETQEFIRRDKGLRSAVIRCRWWGRIHVSGLVNKNHHVPRQLEPIDRIAQQTNAA